jgi:hypothetical protein
MKTTKFTPAQQAVIDYLKAGAVIVRTRAIGTRFRGCTRIEDPIQCRSIKNIPLSTFIALRDKFKVLDEVESDYHMTTYTLKP